MTSETRLKTQYSQPQMALTKLFNVMLNYIIYTKCNKKNAKNYRGSTSPYSILKLFTNFTYKLFNNRCYIHYKAVEGEIT